jgi:superfamily II DNA/RNA helicase
METLPAQRRRHQTLLFSATMTDNLGELEHLAMSDPVKYDLTKVAAVPATLTQEYLFMPAQVSAVHNIVSSSNTSSSMQYITLIAVVDLVY